MFARLPVRPLVFALALASAHSAFTATPQRPAITPPLPATGEVIVRAQAGETLKQIAIRTLMDTGDLTKVVARNRLRTATTPLPAGTAVVLPVASMIALPLTARVASTTAGVQVRAANGSLRAVQANDAVSEAESVVAAASASALLVLPDGSRVQVTPNSELQIQRLRKIVTTEIFQIELNVVAGTAEASVQKERTANSLFNLRTRRAVTGIRGTELRVSELADASTTEVLSGAVAVAGASGQSVAVPAGKGTFVDPAGKPAAPITLLNAPDVSGSGTLYERLTLDIAFGALPGAQRYRTRVVADAPGGALVLAEGTSNAPSVSLNAPPDGAYRLTVRGIDVSGLEGFEATRPITIKARPVPPVAIAPSPAQTLYAPDVTFKWSEPEGVNAYQIEVEDASGKKVLSTADQRAPQAALAALAPGQYRWRLASIARVATATQDIGPRSDWFTFSVEAAPTLGAKPTASGGISLNWTGKADARYVLDLAADAQFARIVQSKQVAGLTTELASLDPGVYFLRVRRDEPGAAFGPAQRISLLRAWQTGAGVELLSSDGTPVDQR
jgi:hypothetical protein